MRPLVHAEQAVLGAILLDPEQLDRLDWLEPSHFDRPLHRALFTAMRHLRAQGQPTLGPGGSVPLSWLTDTVAEAAQHVRGLTEVYAHTLITACPRPQHAPLYGRMVLEGAIHRTVTAHAVRLHQTARADTLRGDVTATLHDADILATVLDDLAHRWGSPPHPTTPAPTVSVMPEPDAESADDERALLGLLTQQPAGMEEVAGWLRPDDFTTLAHAQLYRCLGALYHRGEPIDRMTLLWEAQRRGLLTDGTLTAEEIAALCDSPGPGSPGWLGEQILRTALLNTAAATADTIRALAETDALAPGPLINQALAALSLLDEIRQRWSTAALVPASTGSRDEHSGSPPLVRLRAARARSSPTTPATLPPPQAARRDAPPTPRPPARNHP